MNAVIGKQDRRLIRTISVAFALVCLVAWLPKISLAESPLPSLAPLEAVSPFFGNGFVVGGGYPFRASTPAESFARGVADVIRARGEFNRLTSEAAINAQEARARAIVNAQEGVKAYFKIREMNRDYRSAERGPRPTQEELARYASAAKPAPLSPSELDTLTGRVNWPILLREPRFETLRTEMEELLDRWAVSHNLGKYGSFGPEEHLAVRNVTDRMEEGLRAQVHNLHPQDYSAAKRFLRSLEYQVLQSSDASGVSLAVR